MIRLGMLRSVWLAVLCSAFARAADMPPQSNWPRFLGPADNCTSPEKGLTKTFPSDGLKPLWQAPLGSGFGGPAIDGERLVLFHRVDGKEIVECRKRSSGDELWRFAYDADYVPQYGGSLGPRTSPVIADGHVFTFGVTGQLHCFDIATGEVRWKRDCKHDFAMRSAFFGHGSTPLVMGKRLIVQVGGEVDGKPVNSVALDVATGKLLWAANHEWGASYASPIPANLHGRECVLVFAGGKSRPPTGGLLVIDAENGKVLAAVPHRAEIAESVSASSPVIASAPATGPARIFVSEVYGAGGLCVEIGSDFAAKPAWRAPDFGLYWMTPAVRDGCIFGFSGQSDRLAELVCCDVASGRERWRSDFDRTFGRGNLLVTADGVLCLGETGELAWLELDSKGAKVLSRTRLFEAPETWTLPALSGGLLFVQQNERGRGETKPRLLCYDLRAK